MHHLLRGTREIRDFFKINEWDRRASPGTRCCGLRFFSASAEGFLASSLDERRDQQSAAQEVNKAS